MKILGFSVLLLGSFLYFFSGFKTLNKIHKWPLFPWLSIKMEVISASSSDHVYAVNILPTGDHCRCSEPIPGIPSGDR